MFDRFDFRRFRRVAVGGTRAEKPVRSSASERTQATEGARFAVLFLRRRERFAVTVRDVRLDEFLLDRFVGVIVVGVIVVGVFFNVFRVFRFVVGVTAVGLFGVGRYDGLPTAVRKSESVRRRRRRKRNENSDKKRQNARSATRDGAKSVPKGAASARRGVGGGENEGFHSGDFS